MLSNYNLVIPFSFSISFRNILIVISPILTGLLSGLIIFLKTVELFSILFVSIFLYLLVIIVLVTIYFIYKFLVSRKTFLVQSKLEYLQRKFALLESQDSLIL